MKHYLWPYTNRWRFDEKSGFHRQEIAVVRPACQEDEEAANWPGFVRVELLHADLSPTGVYNYVLPEQLYSDRGYRIGPWEAERLLQGPERNDSRQVSVQLSARTKRLSRLRRPALNSDSPSLSQV